MLALQYFKKSTCEVVLNTLAVTGQVGPALYTLSQGPQPNQLEQFDCLPLSMEGFLHQDDLSNLRYMQAIMADQQAWASCLVIPQFQISYSFEDGWHHLFTPSLYGPFNGYSELVDKLFIEKRPTYVDIFPVVTMTYEYPVASQVLERATAYYPAKMQQISGCTWQVLVLKPKKEGKLGYDFHSSREAGSEYGQPLATDLLGRGLKDNSIFIEDSRYVGHSPWTFTVEDALSLGNGNSYRESPPFTTK